MPKSIGNLIAEDKNVIAEAKGQTQSLGIFSRSHARIHTELSLNEVMQEGKEHTLRRYSQTVLQPPPTIMTLLTRPNPNQLPQHTYRPGIPLAGSELNPVGIREPQIVTKNPCGKRCLIM